MNRFLILICSGSTFLAGCLATGPTQKEADSKNALTSGQVQITIKKDLTTQTEILEVFGSPNLVTMNSSGEDVWTYQRNATVSSASSSSVYGTVLLFGGSTNTSGFEQSSRSMTLIIKFKEINGAKRVSDFSSRTSSF